VVEPATVRSILYTYADPRVAAQKLVQAARDNGAPDNATCIVMRYQREAQQ
jgi:serine/threonine protein phosphatase PrpC